MSREPRALSAEIEQEARRARVLGIVALATADAANAVAIPIKVRGQVIGVVDGRKRDGSRQWTQEEIALMQTQVEQSAVALESARLYQDTQLRAARERLINEITARIRSSATVEAILNSAVREISQLTSAQYATIELELPEIDSSQ